MSLFGDLPPPTAHLRPKQEKLEDEYKPLLPTAQNEKPEGEEPGDQAEGVNLERPDKRQRIDPPNSSGLSHEQVCAALTKICSHISNPDKFSKASGLLRQLLDTGALTKAHRDQLFDVVKAAFADFDNASEASLRRDYMKLCHCLDRQAEQLFSRGQRAHLEVYRLVGFLQNEMHTDDSFVFNKVLGRIKDAVTALPPATEEDDEALAELQAAAAGISSSSDDGGDDGDGGDDRRRGDRYGRRGGAGGGSGEGDDGSGGGAAAPAAAGPQPGSSAVVKAEEERAVAAAEDAVANVGADAEDVVADVGADAEDAVADVGADAEADPFGLDQLLPAPTWPRARPPPPPLTCPAQTSQQHPVEEAAAAAAGGGRGSSRRSAVWTASQALVMRRQALIECLITARSFHKTPWARTSVELLVEHFARHTDRFTAEQRPAVEEMVRFVRVARQARPLGPSQKELNRDSTSFERARAEWSRVHVSARGKVGASGDAKANNWLG